MLRKANVVDAGALGFVELVAGMSDYLDTGVVPEGDGDIELLRGEDSAAGSQQNLEHRYCTECTITGDDIDRRHLREEASALGSSLVVAGTQKKLRLHLHLNEPAQAVRARRTLRHGQRREGRRHAAAAGDGAPRCRPPGRGGHRFRGRPAGAGARGARHPRGAGAPAFRQPELPRQDRHDARAVLPRARGESAASEDLAAAARAISGAPSSSSARIIAPWSTSA